jgi:hypothetical protein
MTILPNLMQRPGKARERYYGVGRMAGEPPVLTLFT